MFGKSLIIRLLLFVLVLLSLKASAQDAALDSMLLQYRTGEVTPKLLNDLCWAYVFNKPDSALHYGRLAVALSQKQKNQGNEATAFNRMGVAYDIKHMPDSALLYYHNAVHLSRKGGDARTTAGALNNIGLIHWNLGDLEKAVDYYVQSAELFEQQEDNKPGLAHTYNNIGLVLWEDGNLDEALRYSHMALSLRKQINDRHGLGASYTNIGLISEDMGKTDSAIHYLKLSIPIKQELNDEYGLAKSYHNLAATYDQNGFYDLAIPYFLAALEISDRLGNDRSSASTLFYLGAVMHKKNDLNVSLDYLKKSETLCDNTKDAKLVWKVYREMAEVRAKQGKFQEATELLFRTFAVKDSTFNLEKREAMEELEVKYRTALKDKRIEEQERVVLETSLVAQRRNTYVIILVALLIILTLVGMFYIQHSRRKADRERTSAIIHEREMGIRAVLTATEEERKRIAKDLHDGVVQGLTGLKLRLQNQLRKMTSLEKGQEQGFEETVGLLDASINEVRDISHSMMPRALGELGLVPALQDLLEKTFSHTDIQFSFEHLRVGEERFDGSIEINLYRISQELVNNIIKHSGATDVSVQLLRTGSHLVLVVEDNGKGFGHNGATAREGIGLMNISSRAKAMNGEVEHAPGPKQGTVTTLRIPIA